MCPGPWPLQSGILLDLKDWVHDSASARVPVLSELQAFNATVAKQARLG